MPGNTTRLVIVAGIGASGTSAIAGALHAMGVPMGHEAHMGTHPAGFGLYEDAEFYGVFQRGDRGEIKRLVLRHARKPVFGFKNTLAFKCFEWLPAYLRELDWDTRIVACHRIAMASAQGREEGRCPPGAYYSRTDARRWVLQALHEYTGALLATDATIYHVQHEWLLNDPADEIEQLARFVFDGLDVPVDLDAGIGQITSGHNNRRGK